MSSDDDKYNRWNLYLPEHAFSKIFKEPIKYIRENFVLPFRQSERPVYYHQRFDRVPTIDQCEIGDPLCRYEANVQFQRDKMVDTAIVKILHKRLTECSAFWGDDAMYKCQKEAKDAQDSEQNHYLRYGEVGGNKDVLEVYMKQKHRMIWLRRRIANGDVNASYRD